MDCLFCKIAAKKISSEIIYEDEWVTAFLDVNPLTEGHTLIVPKKHAENILDLDDNAIGPVFAAVKKVTAMLEKSLHPRGFTIGINHGKISGQSIDHLHIHVIPRYTSDGGGSLHSVVHFPPTASLKETKNKILNA
ncbi:MAG TPA: HIT family protein [Candidatus Colwellbacteria bacterium]|nr:HIT family protein [Candidatus Colwellbacteria bacterium]HQA96077.1 HIT family protein [Candidatus Colwellbacteria bacterium]